MLGHGPGLASPTRGEVWPQPRWPCWSASRGRSAQSLSWMGEGNTLPELRGREGWPKVTLHLCQNLRAPDLCTASSRRAGSGLPVPRSVALLQEPGP